MRGRSAVGVGHGKKGKKDEQKSTPIRTVEPLKTHEYVF